MTESAGGAPYASVDLDAEERYLLKRGLAEWGGPAGPTDEVARFLGFSDVDNLLTDGRRLKDLIDAGEPLSRTDWRRVLLCTEIAFASVVVGAGWDWSITTGISDQDTINLLRRVQRKVSEALRAR